MRTYGLSDGQYYRVISRVDYTVGLILRFACHTGLRISDVLRVKTSDLCRRFVVLESKTKKRQTVTIGKKFLSELLRQAGTTYVFESPRIAGQPRSRQNVWQHVKKASMGMKVANCAPHSFRKRFAEKLYERHWAIQDIQKRMNHDNIATTLMYLLRVIGNVFGKK